MSNVVLNQGSSVLRMSRYMSTLVKNQHGTEYVNLVKKNDRMFKYYRLQGIDTPEWRNGLKRPLNQSFRINKTRNEKVVFNLQKEAEKFLSIHGGRRLNDHVFQLNIDRWAIKGHLKRFLNEEDKLGNLARQELVSMVPVQVLDIQKHHKVLDLCASPGSKTKQALEYLSDDEGFVIANESDPKRCFMLAHELSTFASSNFMAVNHDGRHFSDISPDLR